MPAVFCTPSAVWHSIINGRQVVREGELRTVDLPLVVERHNALARELAPAA